MSDTEPHPTGEQHVPATNGASWVKKYGPWIATALLLAGFLWNSWLQPSLAQSFVTAQRGAKLDSALGTHAERLNKHELRIQRVEDAVVSTREILGDIRDDIKAMRKRK